MKSVMFLVILSGVPVVLDAQTVTAPKIPDSVRARFWKAQAQMLSLQSSIDRANAEMDRVRQEMAKACGDTAQPRIDTNGEPICQVKETKKVEPEKK